MYRVFFTLIFAVVAISPTLGQTARFAANGTLVLSDGEHRFRFDGISEPVDGVPTAPAVHAVQKWHGKYFMVVTTSVWTRGSPSSHGPGGCGTEEYLTWLRIADGKVEEKKDYRINSWSDNREGGIDGWKGPIFSASTTDLLEDRSAANEKDIWQDITYSYDIGHPDEGIKEDKPPPHP